MEDKINSYYAFTIGNENILTSTIEVNYFSIVNEVSELDQNIENFYRDRNTDKWVGKEYPNNLNFSLIDNRNIRLSGIFNRSPDVISNFLEYYDKKNKTKYRHLTSGDLLLETSSYLKKDSLFKNSLSIFKDGTTITSVVSKISILLFVSKDPINKNKIKKFDRIIEIHKKFYLLKFIAYEGDVIVNGNQYEKIIELFKSPHEQISIFNAFEIKSTSEKFDDFMLDNKTKTLRLDFVCLNHRTRGELKNLYKYQREFYEFQTTAEMAREDFVDLRYRINDVSSKLNNTFETVSSRNPENYLNPILQNIYSQSKSISSLKLYLILLLILNIVLILYLYFTNN